MKVFCNYHDGTFDDMDNIDFKNIKRDKLKSFALFRDDNTPIFELFYEPNQRPIYRRRGFNIGGGGNQYVYIIGWQRTIGGENIQSLNFISDNVVIQKSKFTDGAFIEPEWHKYETENSTCKCEKCNNI